MQGGGCSAAEARTVAQRLVDSNLVGHDSHGVLRVAKYLEWVRDGTLKPNTLADDRVRQRRDRHHRRQPRLRTGHRRVRDAARHRQGGEDRHRDDRPAQLRPPRAARRLGRDGRRRGAGLAAFPQHVGRAARRAVRRQRPAAVDESDGDRRSARRRAAGDPRHHDVDRRRGQAHGRAEQGRAASRKAGSSTRPAIRRPNPKDFYDGGALLTIGAHKGSGLSILTDLLAGAVTTGRSSDPADTILRNNMLSIYIAPAVYDRMAACWPRRSASSSG